MTTLAQEHDCLLLDLDGTVFRGQRGHHRRRRDAGRRRSPHALRHQQRVAGPGRGRAAPDRAGIRGRARRRRHQRAECCASARGPIAFGINRSRRRDRFARGRGPQCRAPAGTAVLRRPGRRRTGPLTADGLDRPRRGGAGDPRRRAVGRRQRRPHPAVRARPAARQRLDGRRAARRHRPTSPRWRASPHPRC